MDVQNQIQNFIETELLNNDPTTHLDEKMDLIESGTIDSLGIVKLIAYLEKAYSIQITEDDIVVDNFATIEAISTLLRKKLS